MAILLHPKIKAFKGWRIEPEPWSSKTISKYVHCCHVNILFPLYHHRVHWKSNKVSLAYFKDFFFVKRCLEVWNTMYLKHAGGFQNDNFSLFLVNMVYAKFVLKKKVDWSTLKDIPKRTIPKDLEIPEPDIPINVTEMLTNVKVGKSYIPNECIEWSGASSSNEHTHEYDGHFLRSDDEDVSVEDILAALEVPLEFDMKGFGDEEPLPKPNTNEEGMDDGKAKGINQVSQELRLHGGSDSESDSKEEKEMLIAQIESTTLALHTRREQLGHPKEHEVNPTSEDGLKQKLKAINDIIEENEKVFHAFKRNQDHYLKKHEWWGGV